MVSEPGFDLLLEQRFDSFEELASIVQGYDVDFRQLDASQFQHFLMQARVDDVLVSRARFGCHVDQRGATPNKLRTFALLDPECPEMHWYGHCVGPGVLLAFPMHGEVEVFSRPGFTVSTFSVNPDALGAFFEHSGGPAFDDVLGPDETIITLSPQLLPKLREQLRKVSGLAHSLSGFPGLVQDFTKELFTVLLMIFRSLRKHWPIHQQPSNSQLINRVVEFVNVNRDTPLSLTDLCNVGQVSENTLINAFKRGLGMTPMAYVKGLRLYNVHRELWRAKIFDTRVSDVANSWGFWHMGQFATDYRKLFGELPSKTLTRLS